MKSAQAHQSRRPAPIAALLLGLLAAALAWSCNLGGYSGKVETITVGAPPLEQNALIYIADQQKLFAANGLNVIMKDYDSGVTAIDGLLKGEVDIAESAEFPFIRAVFQKEPIRIIASNDKFENDYVVGRRDRGIEKVGDLKGKRIGVTRQTINEFYLGRFLELNGMSMQEVFLADLAPAQFVEALTSGSVDAIIAWQPYVSQIQGKQANEVVAWPAQGNQAVYGVLVCGDAWLTQHKGTVQRFLKSLSEAEDYLARHSDEGKATVKRRLNYDDSYMASVWPRHQFSLSLDFSLLVAMNDEARWVIGSKLTSEKQAPSFLDYVFLDGLRAVKPQSVNITR